MFSFIPFPWTIFSVSHAAKNHITAGCMGARPSPNNLHSVHTSPINLWSKCKHFVAPDAGGSVSALRGQFAFDQDTERIILPAVGHDEFSFFCFCIVIIFVTYILMWLFWLASLVSFKIRLNRLIVFPVCSLAVITGQTHIYDTLSIFPPSRGHQPISLYYLSSSKRMQSSVLFGFSAVILQKQSDWSASLTP